MNRVSYAKIVKGNKGYLSTTSLSEIKKVILSTGDYNTPDDTIKKVILLKGGFSYSEFIHDVS